MSGHLYKRGRIWHCWYYEEGEQVRRSTGCTDRRAAAAKLAEWERSESGAPRVPSDAPAHSVSDAVEHLAAKVDAPAGTRHMWRVKSGHLDRLLGALDVSQIDPECVRGYVADREKEGAHRSTIRKELATLRRALLEAAERGYFIGDARAAVPSIRVRYEPRTRHLSPKEAEAVLGTLQPHRKLWTLVAIYTGGRSSEVEGLRWPDVEARTKIVRLRGTKTEGAGRIVPYHPHLRRILEPLRGVGRVVEPWGNVRRDLHAACARVGCDPVSPNDLRRTFASWLVQAGESALVVSRLLGHTSTRMVDLVYGQLTPAALRQAAKSLPTVECDTGVITNSARKAKTGMDGKRQKNVSSSRT